MASIRQGGAADLEAVHALNQEAFPEAWTHKGLAAALDTGHLLLVAEIPDPDGQPQFAGYLLCHDVLDETHIMQVAVAPKFRRQGIARDLTLALSAMKSEAKTRTILLEVRASNIPARKLYASLGFHEVGIRPKYYIPKRGDTEREDAVLMNLSL